MEESDSSHARDVYLVGRIADGDGVAFEEFLDRHSSLALGLLARMLGERAEAEEVLQEVFLQIWNRASDYRFEKSTPRGWLIMLSRSRALDRLRSRSARKRREETSYRERSRLEETTPPVGLRRLEQWERHQQVRNALTTLPEEQRSCIQLAYFDGLTGQQIADRLGAPLGTVKSRILLGMNKLRANLAP